MLLTSELWKDEWDKELTRFLTPRICVGCRGCARREGMRLLIIAQPWRACGNWATRARRSHFRVTWPRLIIHQMHHDAMPHTHLSCLSQAIKTRAPWKRLQMMKYRRPSWLLISFPRKLSTHLLETRREFVESALPAGAERERETKIIWLLCACRVASCED